MTGVIWQTEAATVYHKIMGDPITPVNLDNTLVSYTEAQHLVPHDLCAMPVPSDATLLCMLSADAWHIMRHLGFPTAPAMEYVL